MDDAMSDLQDAIAEFDSATSSGKFCAVGKLAQALADGIDAIVALPPHLQALGQTMDGVTIPGIGNLGNLNLFGGILTQLTNLINPFVAPLGALSNSLHQ